MKDTVDTLVNDVNLYSKGITTALENNHYKEAYDYVKNMQKCLKTIKEYLKMKKELDD